MFLTFVTNCAARLNPMKFIRSVAVWMLWNVPLGKLAPALMAFAVGSTKWKLLAKGTVEQ